jgi:uncharacterized membrane protein YphA (DoxX/SURF4 family)
MLGYLTRVSSFFLIINMVVALTFHLKNKDTYSVYSHALTLLVVFATFLIIGSGNLSLDYYLTH